MFEAAIYTQRRDRLRALLGEGVVLFLGNASSPMNYAGNEYPFRQDSSFLYFWGLDAPGLDATIDLDAGHAVVYGPDPTLDDLVWTGPAPGLADRVAAAGADEGRAPAALAEVVRAARAAGRTVHVLPPYRARHRERLAELFETTPAATEALVSQPLIEAVVALRAPKSTDEVAEMEKALEATHAMHVLGMQQARPGVAERTVAGAVEGIAWAFGRGPAFPVICSARGETLHVYATDHRFERGELALLDAGGTAVSHYAGDVTRVTPVGGRFSERQRAVYETVLSAQRAAIDGMRPGVRFLDLHHLAARHLVEGLKALGLMRGDPDEAVAAGAHALFFPHGLGHLIGLDVHDMEALGEDFVGYDAETRRSDQFGLRSLRFGRALEEGFVLTVEPGLYFIPALIDRWRAEGRHADFIAYDALDAYRGFGGIRIEDDVLVTADGHRVLGPPIPKTVEEVEALASGASVGA